MHGNSRWEGQMSAQTTNQTHLTDEYLAEIASTTIARLVEMAPGTMSVFSMLGLDMCCGGGHPLEEALTLHGIPADPIIYDIALIVSESQDW